MNPVKSWWWPKMETQPVKAFPSPDSGLALSAEDLGKMCSCLEAAIQAHASELLILKEAVAALTDERIRDRAELTRLGALAAKCEQGIRMLRTKFFDTPA